MGQGTSNQETCWNNVLQWFVGVLGYSISSLSHVKNFMPSIQIIFEKENPHYIRKKCLNFPSEWLLYM